MSVLVMLGPLLQVVVVSLARLLGIVVFVTVAVGLFLLLRGGIRRRGSKRTVVV